MIVVTSFSTIWSIVTFINQEKVIDKICFAEFLFYYYIVKKPDGYSVNDCQPVLLDDTIKESNHIETNFSKVIPLYVLVMSRTRFRVNPHSTVA